MCSDKRHTSLNRAPLGRAYAAPTLTKYAITAEELARVKDADDPSDELRKLHLQKRERKQ